MIEAVRRQVGIAKPAFCTTIEGYRNSSAATIPFTMSFLSQSRVLQEGDRVLVCVAGAGMNGGAIMLSL